jgi:radical SAM protein with 4Fe4S-binding SPASM domain
MLALPKIRQIEACSACDLLCPMCLRTEHMDRKPKLLKLSLLEVMSKRGEFENTRYIELQMAGEPTLHPRLGDIIDLLHSYGLLVGLSTHGRKMADAMVCRNLLQLDALTISVDSVIPGVYEKLRYPGKFDVLERGLDAFFAEYQKYQTGEGEYDVVGIPVVDLQVIDTELAGGEQLSALNDFMEQKGWAHWRARSVRDAFMEMDGRSIVGSHPRPGRGAICLEPFTSVSITADGDVVPCCLIFDPKPDSSTWLGNIHRNTLREIWEGDKAMDLRWQHRSGRLTGECKACYEWPLPDITGDIVREIARAR